MKQNAESSRPLMIIISAGFFIVIIGLGILYFSGNATQLGLSSEEIPITGTITESLDFKIQLIDSSEVMLSAYAGKPIILDFFATWCVPCIVQLDYFRQVRNNFPQVQILSVSADLNEDLTTLTQFKVDNNIDWVVGRDFTQKGAQIFSVNVIPTLAFINSEGAITHWEQGITDYETLAAWINED